MRAHEETEDRKQPATRERGAVLDEWEGLVGGGDGNLAHWRDSIAAGLRSFVCFGRRRVTLATKEKAQEKSRALPGWVGKVYRVFNGLRGEIGSERVDRFVSLTLVY